MAVGVVQRLLLPWQLNLPAAAAAAAAREMMTSSVYSIMLLAHQHIPPTTLFVYID